MASKVVSSEFKGLLTKRFYASPAAAAKKVEHTEKVSLPKQDAKTTTLPNGLIVASFENYCPVSRVGVMIKAGPRYEPANHLGISHILRNSAGLATEKSSCFRIVKNIEQVGGNFHASCSKENMFYELSCGRDHLDQTIRFLGHTISAPKFFPWELSSVIPRVKVELETHKADPIAVLLEALHKASFHGGLRNSLYSPDFMVGKHNITMLQEFRNQTFGAARTAIVGLGVEHDQLVNYVNKYFSLPSSSDNKLGASKFKGGDYLIDYDSPVTYAAVVAEGAGLNNQKDLLCLALLSKVLGEGPQVKYSDSTNTKLGAAARKVTENPFAVSGLNISYSDTGLFGFVVAGQPNDMDKLLKGLVAEMKALKKVTAQDIAAAKHRLKACVQMSLENQSDLLEEMALSALSTGQLVIASDLVKEIDAISAQDISAVATKVLKGRPAIAAIGQLQKTPGLDELIV